MDMRDFDIFDASLTLRNLTKEEKQGVVSLLLMQKQEAIEEYATKNAVQRGKVIDNLRAQLLVSIVCNIAFLIIIIKIIFTE